MMNIERFKEAWKKPVYTLFRSRNDIENDRLTPKPTFSSFTSLAKF